MRRVLSLMIALGALAVGPGCGGTTVSGPPVTDELRQVCPGLTDDDLNQLLAGIQQDFNKGSTKEEEISALNDVCQNDACVTCFTAAVNLVYGD